MSFSVTQWLRNTKYTEQLTIFVGCRILYIYIRGRIKTYFVVVYNIYNFHGFSVGNAKLMTFHPLAKAWLPIGPMVSRASIAFNSSRNVMMQLTKVFIVPILALKLSYSFKKVMEEHLWR